MLFFNVIANLVNFKSKKLFIIYNIIAIIYAGFCFDILKMQSLILINFGLFLR